MVRFLNEIDYLLNKCFNPKLKFTFMYDNLKNYATKALIVSALLGGNSVMMQSKSKLWKVRYSMMPLM